MSPGGAVGLNSFKYVGTDPARTPGSQRENEHYDITTSEGCILTYSITYAATISTNHITLTLLT